MFALKMSVDGISTCILILRQLSTILLFIKIPRKFPTMHYTAGIKQMHNDKKFHLNKFAYKVQKIMQENK